MAKENSIPKEILIAASAAEQIRERNAATAVLEEEETLSKKQTLAGLATTLGDTASATPTNDLQQQALAMLIKSLSHDLAKKEAKEAKEEEELRRLMLARADGIKHEKERRAITQAVCDHRKENGHSRICGQKTSNGHLSLMCNLCYKEFDENTVPPHLMVSGDYIGG